MKIAEFEVENWMTVHEVEYKYNLAETCVSALTLNELLSMSDNKEKILNNLFNTKLDYGPITGSNELKEAILKRYTSGTINNITITHGTINANELILISLLEKGDHLICIKPTYQQLYSFPNSYGVESDFVELIEDNDWQCNASEFEKLIKNNTKMICLCNPNNPTSTSFSKEFLLEISEIARKHNLYILCDEAYRGLTENYEESISDLYELGIATSSLSKVTALPGLRIGWIKANEEIIQLVNDRRDYHIISSGYLNDYLGTVVLNNYDKILERNKKICFQNREILKDFLNHNDLIEGYVSDAGTICFLKYNLDIPSKELCIKLQQETGVFLVPGACFEREYHLRLGLANDSDTIKKGLDIFYQWMIKRKETLEK